MTLSPAIEVCRIQKSFVAGRPVLRDVDFSIGRGEMVALIGASGSGKSTLIRAIGGLEKIDRPVDAGSEAGRIDVLGETMQSGGRISPNANRLRPKIGIVFQQFNLVPRLSTITNVCMGLLGAMPRWRGTLAQFSREETRRAMNAMARVGMLEHALKRGSELSGGQQQRAAIARTLLQKSEIIVADEPIASLDPASARRVMDILAEINRIDGMTVVVSLHQVEYALHYCPRTIALRNGCVVFDGPSKALTPEFLAELYGDESESLFLPGFETAQSPQKEQAATMRAETRTKRAMAGA